MNIAVVGASNNAEKYGNRIVRHLVEEGHAVFPVNPKEKIILNLPSYRKVGDIETAIDIVDIVVPPEVTMKVLRYLKTLGRINVWIQPGAESDEVIAYLEKYSNQFGIITYNQCIMTSLDRVYPQA
ncbi:MAG: CoA-binding protein [Candidatus Komeilibacteria bacterium]|nr:CoA-binding protein [Candidatus Komeilibacteria bacterium]